MSMAKSFIMRIGLIVLCIVMMVGVGIMLYTTVTEDDRNVIDIPLGDGDTKKITFESLALIPGEQCAYDIELDYEVQKQYDLILDFHELEEKTLKDFARVRIESAGVSIYDELLATAFEDENIRFPVDFAKEMNTAFKITYYMPIEVGDEAQGAEALFELRLTATSE
jgi:hypothetical protein